MDVDSDLSNNKKFHKNNAEFSWIKFYASFKNIKRLMKNSQIFEKGIICPLKIWSSLQ